MGSPASVAAFPHGTVASISGNRAGAIVFALLLGAVFIGGAAYAMYRRPARPGTPDIPPAMKPGPSDPELERPRLERMQAWGIVLVAFLAIWMPVVWLAEPSANRTDIENQISTSIANGANSVQLGTQTNPAGFGCVRCHGSDLGGGFNLYNGQVVTVPNLQTVCGGPNFGHPLIHGLSDIINTIAQGRTGTDMPSWSVQFAGPLDDAQINDIVNYILSIQKVPAAKNLCLNPPSGA
jgi:mono/diheme cytochrome c family protein